MIEAMACGVPVVAFPGGSVEEIIEQGVNGFVVGSIEEASYAVRQIDRIDRRKCRERFERRFTARRMATEYLNVYRELAATRSGRVA
jgi:glycosyltransferase involved in cell wall biosynthesis